MTPFYTYPSAQARPISIHTLRVEGDFADNFGYEFDAISIHTLRVEGDCWATITAAVSLYFNPHPPCGGWRISCFWANKTEFISIHTLRVEGDCWGQLLLYPILHFNPHPPCGGWRKIAVVHFSSRLFQSTPSVWRVTRVFLNAVYILQVFQSTPSVWRVTENTYVIKLPRSDFNPHPPCGGWLILVFKNSVTPVISIHTLRVEGDSLMPFCESFASNFNPHPPCGGWRFNSRKKCTFAGYFNPHPPCGGWQFVLRFPFRCFYHFNPHPPCGGWLRHNRKWHNACTISIHTLRVEGDQQYHKRPWQNRKNFNPHPPCGGWLICRFCCRPK